MSAVIWECDNFSWWEGGCGGLALSAFSAYSSVAIQTSYGLEPPRSGVNWAAGHNLPSQRGREIPLVLVINL